VGEFPGEKEIWAIWEKSHGWRRERRVFKEEKKLDLLLINPTGKKGQMTPVKKERRLCAKESFFLEGGLGKTSIPGKKGMGLEERRKR